MIYDINLYNASGRSVELMFRRSGGKWAHWVTIPPNRAKTFSYYGGVALRCSGEQRIYSRVDPPPEYISAGLLSVSFKAQLASDLKIYLLPPSVSPPAGDLPPQPKGFPLRATKGSNQALERTADRRANLSLMNFNMKPEAQLALVSGRSALSR
jgi:hypothetical protein